MYPLETIKSFFTNRGRTRQTFTNSSILVVLGRSFSLFQGPVLWIFCFELRWRSFHPCDHRHNCKVGRNKTRNIPREKHWFARFPSNGEESAKLTANVTRSTFCRFKIFMRRFLYWISLLVYLRKVGNCAIEHRRPGISSRLVICYESMRKLV